MLSGVAPPRTLFPNWEKFSQSARSFGLLDSGLQVPIQLRSLFAQGTRDRLSQNRLFLQCHFTSA